MSLSLHVSIAIYRSNLPEPTEQKQRIDVERSICDLLPLLSTLPELATPPHTIIQERALD